VLARTYAGAKEANGMGSGSGSSGRHIRLEVTAGELLLEALESELSEARWGCTRCLFSSPIA
jgi:hypothetical protein